MIKIPKSKNKGKKYIEIPIGEKLSQIGFQWFKTYCRNKIARKRC